MKKHLANIEIGVIVLAAFAAWLACNWLTPMVVDDCSYAATGRSLSGIWERQSHDYMTWSGRVVAHTVAQALGGIAGKGIFNWVGTMAACLLALLMAKASRPSKPLRPLAVALAVLTLWFVMPDQYVTQFMIAGNMNYICATTLTLVFLWALGRVGTMPTWGRVAVAAGAVVVGAWSEMYAVCVIPALAASMLANRCCRCIGRSGLIVLALYCVGAAVVVLAPGNFARMGGLTGSGATPWGTRVVNLLVFVLQGPLPWVWLATVALWLLLRRRLPGFWRENCFWWVAVLVSLAFCIASGAAWPRTHYPAYAFSAILLMKLVCAWLSHPVFDSAATLSALVAIGIDFFASERSTLTAQARAVDYVAAHASEQPLLPWIGTEPSRKSISAGVFSPNSSNWRNLAFASYHSLSPFAVVPSEILRHVQEHPGQDSIGTAGDYSILRLPDSLVGAPMLRITYCDSAVWVYPSRLARMAAAVGLPLDERYYASAAAMPLGKLIGKRLPCLETSLTLATNDDSFDALGLVATHHARYLYYPTALNRRGPYTAQHIEVVSPTEQTK